MAVSVTGSPILTLNTITTVTSNAATANVDGTAEAFTITPTREGSKMIVIIGGTGSGADDGITAAFTAGGLWAGKAVSLTVAKNTEKMVQLDSAYVKAAAGTIVLTLTPAAGDKLVTDHSAYVKVIEML
jgi:hypothetical protein